MTTKYNFENVGEVADHFIHMAEDRRRAADQVKGKHATELDLSNAVTFEYCADVLKNSNLAKAKFIVSEDLHRNVLDDIDVAIDECNGLVETTQEHIVELKDLRRVLSVAPEEKRLSEQAMEDVEAAEREACAIAGRVTDEDLSGIRNLAQQSRDEVLRQGE